VLHQAALQTPAWPPPALHEHTALNAQSFNADTPQSQPWSARSIHVQVGMPRRVCSSASPSFASDLQVVKVGHLGCEVPRLLVQRRPLRHDAPRVHQFRLLLAGKLTQTQTEASRESAHCLRLSYHRMFAALKKGAVPHDCCCSVTVSAGVEPNGHSRAGLALHLLLDLRRARARTLVSGLLHRSMVLARCLVVLPHHVSHQSHSCGRLKILTCGRHGQWSVSG